MKIGLIDLDQSKKFPNLALMKISAYYKNKGNKVEWYQALFGGEMNKITFKSIPEMYVKEKSGKKNNTLRKFLAEFVEDKRFSTLMKIKDENLECEIEIINTETRESFIRKITDVSTYKGFFIITWKHEEE